MNKQILTLGGIILITIVLFVIFGGKVSPPPSIPETETSVEKIKLNPGVPDITLPLSNAPKDVAWAVFQKYLEYNRNRNLEGVKNTVYKIASVCEDIKTRVDCEARMGLAYQYGSALKKENFVNVWDDEKQIILSTDFKIQEDNSTIGRNRAIIFFIRDESNNLRMLSFSPFKGAVTSKGVASKEELDYRIVRYTEDNDEDGVADYEEECLNTPGDLSCVKTNPKIRDTDGDGWWDGVEVLMR